MAVSSFSDQLCAVNRCRFSAALEELSVTLSRMNGTTANAVAVLLDGGGKSTADKTAVFELRKPLQGAVLAVVAYPVAWKAMLRLDAKFVSKHSDVTRA